MSDDDVIDYMVVEAVSVKISKLEEEAQKRAEKEAEIEEWKKDESLEERIATAKQQ